MHWPMTLLGRKWAKSLPSAVGFSVASYATTGITLLQGLVLSRILGPDLLGFWMSLMLVVTYGQHLHLGIVNAVNRQIPLLQGQGRLAEVQDYANTAASALLRFSCAWMLIGSVIAVFIFRSHPGGAILVCGLAVAEVWYQMYVTLMKTHGRFGVVGFLNVARAAGMLALLPIVHAWTIPGLYLRAAIIAILSVAAAAVLSPVRLAPRGTGRRVFEIVSEGFPLLLVGMVFSVQISIDRLLVASMMGPTSLGEYSLATMLLSIMIVIPGVIGITSYPEMLRRIGSSGGPRQIRPLVQRQTRGILIASVLISSMAVVVSGPVVRIMLPEYVAGIEPAKWLLPGMAALAASMPASYFLQAVRRQGTHLAVSISSLVMHAALIAVLVINGRNLVAVAVATSVAYAAYGIVLYLAFIYYSRSGALTSEGHNLQ
ncbi:MAG: hypothetical protein IPH48_07275 [bacterium]|nr:hypothetical protein [bacterium]